MGNNQSQSQKKHKQHLINPPHLMLNNCKMIITQNSKLLKSSWPFIDKKMYEKWRKSFTQQTEVMFGTYKIGQISKNAMSDFIFIPQYYEYIEMGYCSTNGVVNIIYEMVQDSLIKDIQLRSLNNQPYTQSQIWILLYILAKAASFFHEKDQILGDIRPQNIFLADNEKFIKIATQYSWIGEKTLREKYLTKQKIFLSQAIIRKFSQNISVTSAISFSNDDFAIGMTLAECILLQDLSTIYEISNNQLTISKQKHRNIIQNLLKIKYYPLKLLLFVIGMIQLQQQNRFTSEETSNCLDQFKVQILTQNSIILSKNHLKQCFKSKFDDLQSIFSQFKSNLHSRLFINRELSLSNAYTINGISTVHMVKRTQNQISNVSFLDLSSNLSPIQYRVSQLNENNRSFSPDNRLNNFIERSKKSNILDQFYYPIIHQKRSKSPNQKSKKRLQNLQIYSDLAQSQVKRIYISTEDQKNKRNASPIRLTNHNPFSLKKNIISDSPQMKVFEEKKGEQHFSFQSPEPIKQYVTFLKDNKLYQSNEYLNIPPQIAESIILANHSNEHPESIISFQYSKSNSNRKEREGGEYEIYRNINNFHLGNKKKSSELTNIERQCNGNQQFGQFSLKS